MQRSEGSRRRMTVKTRHRAKLIEIYTDQLSLSGNKILFSQLIKSVEKSRFVMEYQASSQSQRQELSFDGLQIDLEGTVIDLTEAVVKHWAE